MADDFLSIRGQQYFNTPREVDFAALTLGGPKSPPRLRGGRARAEWCWAALCKPTLQPSSAMSWLAKGDPNFLQYNSQSNNTENSSMGFFLLAHPLPLSHLSPTSTTKCQNPSNRARSGSTSHLHPGLWGDLVARTAARMSESSVA